MEVGALMMRSVLVSRAAAAAAVMRGARSLVAGEMRTGAGALAARTGSAAAAVRAERGGEVFFGGGGERSDLSRAGHPLRRLRV